MNDLYNSKSIVLVGKVLQTNEIGPKMLKIQILQNCSYSEEYKNMIQNLSTTLIQN